MQRIATAALRCAAQTISPFPVNQSTLAPDHVRHGAALLDYSHGGNCTYGIARIPVNGKTQAPGAQVADWCQIRLCVSAIIF